MISSWIRIGALTLISIITFQNALGLEPEWISIYPRLGGDWAQDVAVAQDGGYIVAGTTGMSFIGNWAAMYVKFAANGDTLWSKTYGCPDPDEQACSDAILSLDGGGFISAGSMVPEEFYLGREFWLIRLDENGDTLWTRHYGAPGWAFDAASDICISDDGGYLLVGVQHILGTENFDIYAVKTDSLGSYEWGKRYGGCCPSQEERAAACDATSDGGFLITGYTSHGPYGHLDLVLMKVNSSGDSLWVTMFGGGGNDEGHSVRETSDGGSITAGVLGQWDECAYLIKTDSYGNPEWEATYLCDFGARARDVIEVADGYIITGGVGSPHTAEEDIFVLKVNHSGEILSQWISYWPNNDFGIALKPTDDGGFVVACQVGYGFDDDYGVVKFGPDSTIDAIDDKNLPDSHGMLNVFPNPFNSYARIEFSLAKTSQVKLDVYAIDGRTVRTLLSQSMEPGYHSIIWDGTNEDGMPVSSGLYFCTMVSGDNTLTSRMVLLK
jgi:hypothetical protein